jgi:hypothetical protein
VKLCGVTMPASNSLSVVLLLVLSQSFLLLHLGCCATQLTVAAQTADLSRNLTGMAVNATSSYLQR